MLSATVCRTKRRARSAQLIARHVAVPKARSARQRHSSGQSPASSSSSPATTLLLNATLKELPSTFAPGAIGCMAARNESTFGRVLSAVSPAAGDAASSSLVKRLRAFVDVNPPPGLHSSTASWHTVIDGATCARSLNLVGPLDALLSHTHPSRADECRKRLSRCVADSSDPARTVEMARQGIFTLASVAACCATGDQQDVSLALRLLSQLPRHLENSGLPDPQWNDALNTVAGACLDRLGDFLRVLSASTQCSLPELTSVWVTAALRLGVEPSAVATAMLAAVAPVTGCALVALVFAFGDTTGDSKAAASDRNALTAARKCPAFVQLVGKVFDPADLNFVLACLDDGDETPPVAHAEEPSCWRCPWCSAMNQSTAAADDADAAHDGIRCVACQFGPEDASTPTAVREAVLASRSHWSCVDCGATCPSDQCDCDLCGAAKVAECSRCRALHTGIWCDGCGAFTLETAAAAQHVLNDADLSSLAHSATFIPAVACGPFGLPPVACACGASLSGPVCARCGRFDANATAEDILEVSASALSSKDRWTVLPCVRGVGLLKGNLREYKRRTQEEGGPPPSLQDSTAPLPSSSTTNALTLVSPEKPSNDEGSATSSSDPMRERVPSSEGSVVLSRYLIARLAQLVARGDLPTPALNVALDVVDIVNHEGRDQVGFYNLVGLVEAHRRQRLGEAAAALSDGEREELRLTYLTRMTLPRPVLRGESPIALAGDGRPRLAGGGGTGLLARSSPKNPASAAPQGTPPDTSRLQSMLESALEQRHPPKRLKWLT
jgi:hypothetical protein